MYASQVGFPEPVKERFYDQLQYAVAKVYGGHGFDTRNMEGERILEFDIATA